MMISQLRDAILNYTSARRAADELRILRLKNELHCSASVTENVLEREKQTHDDFVRELSIANLPHEQEIQVLYLVAAHK